MLSQRSASEDKLTSFVLKQFQKYGNVSETDFNATSFIDELQKEVSFAACNVGGE